MFFPYKIDNVSYIPTPINTIFLFVIFVGYLVELSYPYGVEQVINSPLLNIVFSNFIHENWMHLVSNLIFYYFFGNIVSRFVGNKTYLFLIVLVSLITYMLDRYLHEITFGASAIVSAFMGVSVAVYPFFNFRVLYIFGYANGIFKLKIIWVVMLFLLADLSGLFSYIEGKGFYDDVAYWDHIAGFLIGFFVGYVGLRDKIITAKIDGVHFQQIIKTPDILTIQKLKTNLNKQIVNGWAIYILLASFMLVLAILESVRSGFGIVDSYKSFLWPLLYVAANVLISVLILLRQKSGFYLVFVLFFFNVVMCFSVHWNIFHGVRLVLTILLLMQATMYKVYWPRFGM